MNPKDLERWPFTKAQYLEIAIKFAPLLDTREKAEAHFSDMLRMGTLIEQEAGVYKYNPYSKVVLAQVLENCRKLSDGALHDIIQRSDTSLILKEGAKYALIERGHPPDFSGIRPE